jgi:ribosomal protein L35
MSKKCGGKQKPHKGLLKRVKLKAGARKKSGNTGVFVDTSCKRHLLLHKSKRQKNLYKDGMPVNGTRMKAIRRLLPGKIRVA